MNEVLYNTKVFLFAIADQATAPLTIQPKPLQQLLLIPHQQVPESRQQQLANALPHVPCVYLYPLRPVLVQKYAVSTRRQNSGALGQVGALI